MTIDRAEPTLEHFDLVDLRLFVNIAELSSLTRGAERSHLSLPAASTRIKNLEEHLGVKLLFRSSQGVTMTPAGDALLVHALIMQRQMGFLCADLQEYAQGLKGHVRVFANTSAITEFLPSVLRQFLTTHPDVNVDLQEHLSHDIVRAVSLGTTDIGIVAGNILTEGLEVLQYRLDHLILVCANTHPLAQRESIDFSETLQMNYIGLPEGSAIHGFLNEVSKFLQWPLKMRIQVGNFEAMCRMIEADVGVSILPRSSAARYAETMAISLVELTNKWAVRDLKICVRNLKGLPVFAMDLVKMLVADGQSAIPSTADSTAKRHAGRKRKTPRSAF